MKPKTLLFDLGGVLADLADPVSAMSLAQSDEEFWRIWLNSPSVRDFETGNLSVAEFCERIGDEFGIEDGAFDTVRFSQWQLRLFPGIEDLLSRVTTDFSLALLSNTNPSHWQQVSTSTGLFADFSRVYLSYEIGMMKPAIDIFEHVIDDLGCRPAEIVFFDDTAKNIDMASIAGIDARHVRGFDELRSELAGIVAC